MWKAHKKVGQRFHVFFKKNTFSFELKTHGSQFYLLLDSTMNVFAASQNKKREEILACQSCLLETATSSFIWRFMRLDSVCSIKATLLVGNSAV